MAIADGTVQLAKGTVNSAVWFAKEAVNGVLYSGKYAYDNYVPSTDTNSHYRANRWTMMEEKPY
ncbi:hypothetical protein [Wolbachia endosymbiont (group A) of Campoletis raptor]|uniref:hypothetical protein n=1 Tax=Wolbachia endosymbiont (group A) of Campoletis raptor TaxID=3066196 RepID=UPI003132D037